MFDNRLRRPYRLAAVKKSGNDNSPSWMFQHAEIFQPSPRTDICKRKMEYSFLNCIQTWIRYNMGGRTFSMQMLLRLMKIPISLLSNEINEFHL